MSSETHIAYQYKYVINDFNIHMYCSFLWNNRVPVYDGDSFIMKVALKAHHQTLAINPRTNIGKEGIGNVEAREHRLGIPQLQYSPTLQLLVRH